MENLDKSGNSTKLKKCCYSFNTLIGEGHSRSSKHEQFLIVTADDYGYAAPRDEGIVECFTKGIVTRASLLVNGSSAKTSAVQLAKESNMPLGIHLNLTEGEAIGDHNWSLLDGRFLRGKFGLREALTRGEIDMAHVKNEVIAQIKIFLHLVGYFPNHVDGHQHIHILPGIREVIAEVMQTYSLGQIRIPLENHVADWFEGNKKFFHKVFQDAKVAIEVYSKYGIRFPKNFIGISLMGKHMTVEHIMQTLESIKRGDGCVVCELMVHPGYCCVNGEGGCGDGPDEFACSKEREHEANVLKDTKLIELLKVEDIKLIS